MLWPQKAWDCFVREASLGFAALTPAYEKRAIFQTIPIGPRQRGP
jgi:hypothetical protein